MTLLWASCHLPFLILRVTQILTPSPAPGKLPCIRPEPESGPRPRVSKYSFSCKVERKKSVSQVVSASIRWNILMIKHLCWVMLQCNAAVGLITADLESAARSIGPGARFWTWWVWCGQREEVGTASQERGKVWVCRNVEKYILPVPALYIT